MMNLIMTEDYQSEEKNWSFEILQKPIYSVLSTKRVALKDNTLGKACQVSKTCNFKPQTM